MSSPEPRLTLPALIAFALLAATLGGCTFRPLYADASASGIIAGDTRGAGEKLTRIEISAISEREGIELRNQLIFALNGGGSQAQNPLYRLKVNLTKSDSDLAVQSLSGRPTAASVYIAADYTLTDIATGKNIYTARAISRASYDKSVQRFSNIRAEREAENRALADLALFIRNGLASYLANPPPAK